SITRDSTIINPLTKLPHLNPFQIPNINHILPFFPTIPTINPLQPITFPQTKIPFSHYLKKRANHPNKLQKR
ncbi:hypothetical protein, partial [Bacillus velezensis]|uniref:hypothetical protein n=1 Tax=Bacillus velezensis TaxID=492670 RepID=UPI001C92FF4A